MDATSRNLIERAAAHLRRREQSSAMPAAMPMAANGDWGGAAPVQPPRPAAKPAGAPQPAGPGPTATSQPRQAQARPAQPQGDALAAHSRQVAIDRAALRHHGIALPSAGRSRVAEEFRIVKRQVVAKFLDELDTDPEAQKNRVIMVTSAKPGEGKTFAAINLALSIASEQDLKVLLIDLDTRTHAMQEMLGIPATRGLTDLLSNPEVDFSDVVLRTNMPNLAIMPAGHPDNRGPELLSSKRTRGMFLEMTQRYSDRFIIFDAVLPRQQRSSTLASLVGQIVFVVEADHTQQEEVEAAGRAYPRLPERQPPAQQGARVGNGSVRLVFGRVADRRVCRLDRRSWCRMSFSHGARLFCSLAAVVGAAAPAGAQTDVIPARWLSHAARRSRKCSRRSRNRSRPHRRKAPSASSRPLPSPPDHPTPPADAPSPWLITPQLLLATTVDRQRAIEPDRPPGGSPDDHQSERHDRRRYPDGEGRPRPIRRSSCAMSSDQRRRPCRPEFLRHGHLRRRCPIRLFSICAARVRGARATARWA